MANETVNQSAGTAFFAMDARYLVCPESTAGQLMMDSLNFLDSAIAVMETAFESMDPRMYGALYLIQQAKGMQGEAHSILCEAGAIEG